MSPDTRRLPRNFRVILQDAIRHFSETGYKHQDDIARWLGILRSACDRALGNDIDTRVRVRASLNGLYARHVRPEALAQRMPGVSRFTIERIKPALHAELDRRILASVGLIKLRRDDAVRKTLARFQGWATSIPAGGSKATDMREVADDVGKSVAQVKYEWRRVTIDQGAKMLANIHEIVAMQSDAIGGVWHDQGEHRANYDAREEHLKRTGEFFLFRDSWAIRDGYIKRGKHKFMDEIERPGELPYCQCFYTYTNLLADVPPECLTAKGKSAVDPKG
ncbi:MAG: hypothetical protein ACYDBH_01125 [Acidobacteriaceae bacterium]